MGTYHKRELGCQGRDEVGTPSVDVLVPSGRTAQETVLDRGPKGCLDLVVGVQVVFKACVDQLLRGK